MLKRFLLSATIASLLFSGAVFAEPRFTLTTPGVADGAPFSAENEGNAGSCSGKNISPELQWSHAPAGTQSFALIMHDTDARQGKGLIHWVYYGLPAQTTGLATNAGSVPSLGVGGTNDRKSTVFLGPCPPKTDSQHHYVIQLFALDLSPTALEKGLTYPQLMQAIDGHVLGLASYVRTYQR